MGPEIAIVGGGPSGLALAGMLEKSGMSYVVYERDTKDTPPAGGCLDLHKGSGQRAMKEAGCFDEMRKHGRLGDATIAKVYDHQGNKAFSWGEGRDAPELDRYDIRKVLLTIVPEDKIVWEKSVKASERDEQGNIVLFFKDGTTATGFKLVVGADGTWSKIRHLVTPVRPRYSGQLFLTGTITQSNLYYSTIEKIAGEGPMVVMGKLSEDLGKDGTVDLNDADAVKSLMLDDHFFGTHSSDLKAMIAAMEGPFTVWPLWYFPPENLNWTSAPGVTLIEDAAHTTTPFVGDGVNCAMRDSIMLSEKLQQFGVTHEAIVEYEKAMFPFAIDVVERSVASGKLFFHWNSPEAFVDGIMAKPLFGITDDY